METWKRASPPQAPSPKPRACVPQLVLLDEATLVLIQDVEHLLHLVWALFLQADHLEELFVVEGVSSCWGEGGSGGGVK